MAVREPASAGDLVAIILEYYKPSRHGRHGMAVGNCQQSPLTVYVEVRLA